MPKQSPPPPPGGDVPRNRPSRSRHYRSLVLRDSRCRFILGVLRRTSQHSPVHVTELVDEFLVGEMEPVADEELPAVRNDVYHAFSHHCLHQLEAAGLVVYDQYHDTVQLR